MTTEEPQSLPVDTKLASTVPIEDMAIDQPVTKSINGNRLVYTGNFCHSLLANYLICA